MDRPAHRGGIDPWGMACLLGTLLAMGMGWAKDPEVPVRNIASLAYLETSHDRDVKRGQPELAVDGRLDTAWKCGPYAHLVLRYAAPVRVEKIHLRFGEGFRPPVAYRLEGLVDTHWRVLVEVEGNSEAEREHRFTDRLCSGVRYIPRDLPDAGASSIEEFEVWSPDSAQPYAPESHIVADATETRRSAPLRLGGIHVKDHWRDFAPFPDGLPVDGVEYWALWREVEPQEGAYDWRAFDRVLRESRAAGQSIMVKFISEMHCPPWLYQKGVPRVLPHAPLVDREPYRASFSDPYHPPVYWNPIYLAAFTRSVGALGARYDGREGLAGIHLCLAGMGEMGRFAAIPAEDWHRAGYSDEVFIEAMKQVIDAYTRAFRLTPLVLQVSYIGHTQSATPAWVLAEYAAAKGIAIQQNSMDDLWGTCGSRRDSVAGKVNYVDLFDHVRSKARLSVEMNAGFSYNTARQYGGLLYRDRFPEVLWQSVFNSLGLGASQLTVYQADALQPSAQACLRFARARLGRPPKDSPTAWMSLRGEPVRDPHVGLERVEQEGSRAVAPKGWVSNRLCRRSDRATGQARFDFRIEDEWLAQHPGPHRVRVIYLAFGPSAFCLEYPGAGGALSEATVESTSGGSPRAGQKSISGEGPGPWREAIFTLPGAEPGRGVHFSLRVTGGDDMGFHFVEVAPMKGVFEEMIP